MADVPERSRPGGEPPGDPVAAGEAVRVLRVIARLNVGGPALHVSYLTQGLDPTLARIGHAEDRGRTVEEALVVGLDLRDVLVVCLAPHGEARLRMGHSRKLIDVMQSDADTATEHELVGRPAPVINARESRIPAVVPGVRGDARDTPRPETTTRRKGLARPEEMEEHLRFTLTHGHVRERNVALNHATNRVCPSLLVTAVLGQVRTASKQRLEGVSLLAILGEEAFLQTK